MYSSKFLYLSPSLVLIPNSHPSPELWERKKIEVMRVQKFLVLSDWLKVKDKLDAYLSTSNLTLVFWEAKRHYILLKFKGKLEDTHVRAFSELFKYPFSLESILEEEGITLALIAHAPAYALSHHFSHLLKVMREEEKDGISRTWEDYLSLLYPFPQAKQSLITKLEAIRGRGSVLDLGCGEGLALEDIAALYDVDAEGITLLISERRYNALVRRGIRLHLGVFPFPLSSTFDVILDIYGAVFYSGGKLIPHVVKLLKEGGLLYVYPFLSTFPKEGFVLHLTDDLPSLGVFLKTHDRKDN